MGRKIPGKKHRGVKDPVKQQFERKEKLKLLINAPPTDPNMQELPKSVLEMNRLRELAKNMTTQKKKKKKRRKPIDSGILSYAGPKLPGMNQNDLNFPKLTQRPGESDKSFLWRLGVATNEALNEAKLEASHDIIVNRSKTGVITDVKPKPKSSLDDPVGKVMNKSQKRKFSSTPLVSAKDKLSYLKEKKLKKKLKKINIKDDDLEKKVDFVKFGEVVHQPPQIKKRPRGCDLSSFDRPGKKNLLLTSILNPGSDGKSMVHIKQIASAREEAIRVYKDMKARNRQLLKK